ncbi:hypothetical protein R1flu_028210 [Riccia fluitans]|uniref:Uncharacterized protein n=1 Tax=Riccia fluitans TaxID=41844 RepID=A0ABD1XL05_9MARC
MLVFGVASSRLPPMLACSFRMISSPSLMMPITALAWHDVVMIVFLPWLCMYDRLQFARTLHLQGSRSWPSVAGVPVSLAIRALFRFPLDFRHLSVQSSFHPVPFISVIGFAFSLALIVQVLLGFDLALAIISGPVHSYEIFIRAPPGRPHAKLCSISATVSSAPSRIMEMPATCLTTDCYGPTRSTSLVGGGFSFTFNAELSMSSIRTLGGFYPSWSTLLCWPCLCIEYFESMSFADPSTVLAFLALLSFASVIGRRLIWCFLVPILPCEYPSGHCLAETSPKPSHHKPS